MERSILSKKTCSYPWVHRHTSSLHYNITVNKELRRGIRCYEMLRQIYVHKQNIKRDNLSFFYTLPSLITVWSGGKSYSTKGTSTIRCHVDIFYTLPSLITVWSGVNPTPPKEPRPYAVMLIFFIPYLP